MDFYSYIRYILFPYYSYIPIQIVRIRFSEFFCLCYYIYTTMTQFELKRFPHNPVLSPKEGSDWEGEAVFNPAVAKSDNGVFMLYRAVGEYSSYISRFGLAKSDDGVTFERASERPVFEPAEGYEKWAVEDPRATCIDGLWYITYTAVSQRVLKEGKPILEREVPLETSVALATTNDFRTFERLGPISLSRVDDKNAVLFPEKVNGRYALLHRPQRWTAGWFKNPLSSDIEIPLPGVEPPQLPSIWISFSDDLLNWSDHRLLITPSHEHDHRLGAGSPPLRTKAGWLIIYHHVEDKDNGGKQRERAYTAKAALLDLNDPTKVIAKLPYDILVPREEYEKKGDVDNVVFPTGAFIDNGVLYVYYGAADRHCCVATGEVVHLLDELERCREEEC